MIEVYSTNVVSVYHLDLALMMLHQRRLHEHMLQLQAETRTVLSLNLDQEVIHHKYLCVHNRHFLSAEQHERFEIQMLTVQAHRTILHLLFKNLFRHTAWERQNEC